MGLFPIIMNIIQFWIVDTMIKGAAATGPVSLEHDDEADVEREPIFAVTGSDDEEELKPARPRPRPRPAVLVEATGAIGRSGELELCVSELDAASGVRAGASFDFAFVVTGAEPARVLLVPTLFCV